MSYTWDQVIAWLGIVVPLFGVAWAAIGHVKNQKQEKSFREYQKFHELMKQLGQSENGIMGQLAVAYELRGFPQYGELTIRAMQGILQDNRIAGSNANLLANEFEKPSRS